MTEDGSTGGEEHHEEPVADFSVPWWVWVILGFTLLMAVVIVIIIWGGATAPQPAAEPAQPVVEEVAEEPATEPSTSPTTGPTEPTE